MARRSERERQLVVTRAAIVATAISALWRSSSSFAQVPSAPCFVSVLRPPQAGMLSVIRRAEGSHGVDKWKAPKSTKGLKKAVKYDLPINEQIKSAEVRIIAEVSTAPNRSDMKTMDEVMLTRDALERAKSKGVDLVCVNIDADPPIVKIVSIGKYVFDQKRKQKTLDRKGKAPKVKDVKMSYVIGEHDLDTRIRQIEKWLGNPRQQVKVTVVMKGRTRMFEKQARTLLDNVRRQVAPFGKAASGSRDPVSKDGRGDLYVIFSSGPDIRILKDITANAKLQAKEDATAEDEDDEEDDEEDEGIDEDEENANADDGDPALQAELKAVQAEMEEMRQELLDCGIALNKISQQEEMIELTTRMAAIRAKMA